MKLYILLLIVFGANFLHPFSTNAQTVVVTDLGTYTTGQASSVLDVYSTTKGFLAPRLTSAQRVAIASPTDGLLVYQTDLLKGFWFYNATSATWVQMNPTSGNQWNILGNAGTSYPADFVGSTDKVGLHFRTNNSEHMFIDSIGHVGVGLKVLGFNSTPQGSQLVVKDTIDIRRTGSNTSELLFSNTSGGGDFKVAGDGGDFFWQGGGGRCLQMGSYWTTIISGDREGAGPPGYQNYFFGVPIGLLVIAAQDKTIPLAVRANSGSQIGDLTQWQNSGGTNLSFMDKVGNLGLGYSGSTGTNRLQVSGASQLNGTTQLNGNVQLGTNGSVLNSIIKTSFSLTSSTAFTAGLTQVYTAAVANTIVNSVVQLSPASSLPNGIVIAYAYVSANGTITYGIANTGTTTTIGTVNFNAVIIQ